MGPSLCSIFMVACQTQLPSTRGGWGLVGLVCSNEPSAAAQKKGPRKSCVPGGLRTQHLSGSDWTSRGGHPCRRIVSVSRNAGIMNPKRAASLHAGGPTLRGPQGLRCRELPDADPSTWITPWAARIWNLPIPVKADFLLCKRLCKRGQAPFVRSTPRAVPVKGACPLSPLPKGTVPFSLTRKSGQSPD
jgi:hypothetical protein